MKEQNQKQSVDVQEESSSPAEEQKQPNSSSSMKKIFGKKWVFPAAYMAAAAIILSIMWAYQSSDNNSLDADDLGLNTLTNNPVSEQTNTDALPVTTPAEEMEWPADPAAVEVVTPYYDSEASPEEQTAAMIQMDDTFMPSSGISLAKPDNSVFEVKAAMSGTVTRVDNVPYIGNLVEIEHEDGLVTVYSSLAEVSVEKGQTVTQGDVIAQAGRNELQKDLGYHVHFEVMKDGESVNPNEYVKSASLNVPAEDQNANTEAVTDEDAAIEDDTQAEETDASIESETGVEADAGTDQEATDVDTDASSETEQGDTLEMDGE
ncbi:peptidoglycan DD-metalloendopeptidase family protein [Marinicrinis lubricantis]|uniref:Peptidoglycan DD-metalloendopeptidase family protein n=1 Tax=Marinicrinis lubricantis TaxID=2086470 RepID=A0ABW1IKC7_9BACL